METCHVRAITVRYWLDCGKRKAGGGGRGGARELECSPYTNQIQAMAPKSPAVPNLRRSSRASTPTQRATSPRSVTHSTSTPSISTQLLQPSSSSSSSAVRKSTSARSLTPTRPALPKHAANDLLLSSAASANAPGTKLHKVKLQTLHLGEDNGTITIARVKCPVPKGRPG